MNNPGISRMELVFAVMAILLFCGAALLDFRDRRIPNWICLALALLGVARLIWAGYAGSGPTGAVADVILALSVFGVGAGLFAFGLFGGGDVKLIAATVLWLGLSHVGPFLLATALCGGGLAVLTFLARTMRFKFHGPEGKRDLLPYGVAIAMAGILATVGVV